MWQKRFYVPAVFFMALSALFFPFWLTIMACIIFSFLFDSFYPGLVILVVMDALYGFKAFASTPVHGLLSIVGIIGYACIVFLKRFLIRR